MYLPFSVGLHSTNEPTAGAAVSLECGVLWWPAGGSYAWSAVDQCQPCEGVSNLWKTGGFHNTHSAVAFVMCLCQSCPVLLFAITIIYFTESYDIVNVSIL